MKYVVIRWIEILYKEAVADHVRSGAACRQIAARGHLLFVQQQRGQRLQQEQQQKQQQEAAKKKKKKKKKKSFQLIRLSG